MPIKYKCPRCQWEGTKLKDEKCFRSNVFSQRCKDCDLPKAFLAIFKDGEWYNVIENWG